MQNLVLRKAERKQAKIRMGVFGPSGSGKTFSALLAAKGIAGTWEKIAVIDTENGSGELYSHLGPYNVITLTPPYSPEKYVEAIKVAEEAGMEVIIIDSISHEWSGTGGILEEADKLSIAAKNSFTVWNKLTPRHNRFIDAILQSPAHMICCGRAKQDYVLNQVEKNGKTVNVPEKIGLKSITREGFDYEMTVSFDIAINHYASSTKDRTRLFSDKPEFVITEETGKKIKEWTESGMPDFDGIKHEIMVTLIKIYGPEVNKWNKDQMVATVKGHTQLDLIEKNYQEILSRLKAVHQEIVEQGKNKPQDKPANPVIDKQPETTAAAQPAAVQPVKEEVKEPSEPEETISANKLTLLRSLAKDKEKLTEDRGILDYISFFYEKSFEKLEDLPASFGNKIIKELMEKKSDYEEDEMPEGTVNAEVE